MYHFFMNVTILSIMVCIPILIAFLVLSILKKTSKKKVGITLLIVIGIAFASFVLSFLTMPDIPYNDNSNTNDIENIENGAINEKVEANANKQMPSENKDTAESESKTSTEEKTYTKTATLGEENALKKAKPYLNLAGFSKKGLRDQLEYEGFTESEIDYALKNCNANYKEEAAEKAESYLKISSFSKQGLYDQLEYEGFTEKQIQYALNKVGY